MMKKFLSLALLMATASMFAQTDLTVQMVKEDGSVIDGSLKFSENGMQQELDDLIFEVATSPDEEIGYAKLELKIYRKNMQGDVVLLCAGEGKVALNKEEMVQITERTEDDEIVRTMTLTIVVTE